MKDYYSILGVSKTASSDEIRSAFRSRAKEFQKQGMFGVQGEATQEWLDVVEANQTLSKTEARNRYNSELENSAREAEQATTTRPPESRNRYTTNVKFHEDEEEVASVMRGVFRRYMDSDATRADDEAFGLGGKFWRVSYHFGNNRGVDYFSRKYEVRTGQDTWQDIDASQETKFKTAQKWRDFLEQGLFKAVVMENGRYPGDWFDTETSADKLSDFQNSQEYQEFRDWFQEVWPETSDINKVPFRVFWIREEDDFDKSRREYQDGRDSMPSTPENPHINHVRPMAEGRIKFGDVEDDAPKIVWGEPTTVRIVWGEERPNPKIVFGQERGQRIVWGDEDPNRVV